MNVEAYNQEQVRLHARHAELLKRYTDKPFAVRHTQRDVEHELNEIERAVLDNPPFYKTANGHWRRRRKGLILPNRLESPRSLTLSEAGIEVIPIREWDDYIGGQDDVDLRKLGSIILDQDGVGSCASEAKDNAVETAMRFAGQKPVRFNPWGTYGRVNGGRDAGSSLQDNIAFGQRYGCFPEDVWSRSNGWRAEPSDEAYQEARKYRLLEVARARDWEEFGTLLLVAVVINFGYPGHAIDAVSLLSTTRLQYENSWDISWGDEGYGTLNKGSIEWRYGAYGYLSIAQAA